MILFACFSYQVALSLQQEVQMRDNPTSTWGPEQNPDDMQLAELVVLLQSFLFIISFTYHFKNRIWEVYKHIFKHMTVSRYRTIPFGFPSKSWCIASVLWLLQWSWFEFSVFLLVGEFPNWDSEPLQFWYWNLLLLDSILFLLASSL